MLSTCRRRKNNHRSARDAGVDVVTISKRLGHASPAITLKIYAHLFRKDDGKASAAINAALSGPRKT
jgi:integrase